MSADFHPILPLLSTTLLHLYLIYFCSLGLRFQVMLPPTPFRSLTTTSFHVFVLREEFVHTLTSIHLLQGSRLLNLLTLMPFGSKSVFPLLLSFSVSATVPILILTILTLTILPFSNTYPPVMSPCKSQTHMLRSSI